MDRNTRQGLTTFLGLVAASLVLLGGFAAYDQYKIAKARETHDMCDQIDKGFGLNGMYVTDTYYCVWTKGRTSEQIATAEQHELCHALVDKDYMHFCTKADLGIVRE